MNLVLESVRSRWRFSGGLLWVLFALALPTAAHAGFAPEERLLSEAGIGAAEPATVVDGQGNTTAVWRQDPEAGNGQVALRRLAADGTLGPVKVLSESGEHPLSPDVAVAPDGSVFVVWRHEAAEPMFNSISGRWVHPNGTFGPVLSILEGSASDDGAGAQVVIGAEGVATAAWYDQAGGQKDRVELRRIQPDSEQSGVIDTTLNAGGEFKSAALPGGATLLVVGAITDVVSSGGVVATPLNASTSGGVSTSSPGLAVDPSGDVLLVWRRELASKDAIIARRLNSTGVPLGEEIVLEPSTSNFLDAGQSAAVDSEGDFLAGWFAQDDVNIGHGFVRAVEDDGSLSGPALAITEVGRGEPLVALDDLGTAVVVTPFQPGSSGTATAVGRLLDVSDNPITGEVPLSAGNQVGRVALASEPLTGVASAVFNQSTGSGEGIFAHRFMEPPTCAGSHATVVLGQPVAVPISCTGIGVTAAHVVTPPAHGTLGPFDLADGTVTFTPTPGYNGPDSFTYAGTNEGADSAPAAASLAIGAAPTETVRDTTPPTIHGFKLLRTRVKHPPHGKPRFTYALQLSYSEPASVRITIERPIPGIVKGKSCRPRHAHEHGRHCTIYSKVSTLSSSKLATSATIPVGASLERALARDGALRMSAVATDAAGNHSSADRIPARLST